MQTNLPIIVSIFALLGVVVSVTFQTISFRRSLRAAHTLRLAEMRQNWINSLRDAMARVQSYGMTPGLQQRLERQFYEEGTRVELLMNPKDPDYDRLQEKMYALLGADTPEQKYSVNSEFVDVCQKIIKREWDRVRDDIESTGLMKKPAKEGHNQKR